MDAAVRCDRFGGQYPRNLKGPDAWRTAARRGVVGGVAGAPGDADGLVVTAGGCARLTEGTGGAPVRVGPFAGKLAAAGRCLDRDKAGVCPPRPTVPALATGVLPPIRCDRPVAEFAGEQPLPRQTLLCRITLIWVADRICRLAQRIEHVPGRHGNPRGPGPADPPKTPGPAFCASLRRLGPGDRQPAGHAKYVCIGGWEFARLGFSGHRRRCHRRGR